MMLNPDLQALVLEVADFLERPKLTEEAEEEEVSPVL